MNQTRLRHTSPGCSGLSLTGLLLVLASLPLVGVPCSAAAGARSQGYFDRDYYEVINGTHLHFRVRGYDPANPYLLILHGGPGASAIEFYPWGELLEKRLNIVYLDQRGCGLSQRAHFAIPGHPTDSEAEGFTFENMIRDIEGVRRRLGLDRWFVLGHSFGGMVGLEYVTAYSEHVLGYIHLNGLISMRWINLDWLDYAERAVERTARTAGPEDRTRVEEVLRNVRKLRSMSAEERQRNIGPLVISKITPERIRDRFAAANAYDARIDTDALARYKIPPERLGAQEPAAAIGLVENLADRDATPLFEDVHMPTLIVSGAEDPIIPTKRAAFMHGWIPQSRLVVIPNAAHEVYKDQQEATASAVLSFVAGTQSK